MLKGGSDSSRDQEPGARLLLLIAWLLFIVLLSCYASPWQQLDSANYYLEGLLISKGYLPYLDFNDNKSPLLYYLLAIPASIAGWSMFSGVLLFRVIDLVIFFLLEKLLRVFGYSAIVRGTVMIFLVGAYAGCFPFVDETIYAEAPELLCRVAGFLIYLRGGGFLRVGMLIGCAALFRQTALIDLVVIGVHQIVLATVGRKGWREGTVDMVSCIAGFLSPLAVVGIVAAAQGWLGAFYHQAIQWNYLFSAAVPDAPEGHVPAPIQALTSLPFLPLVSFALYWVLLGWWRKGVFSSQRDTFFTSSILIVLIFMHLYESMASPLWYVHHLIPSLMALGLAAGAGLERLELDLSARFPRVRTLPIVVGVGLLALLPILLLRLGQFEKYRENEKPGSEISHWIESHTQANDKILVWGYAPHYYLLAHRMPASRFHHNLFLTNQSRRFLPLDAFFINSFRADIANQKPALIILENGSESLEDLREFLPEVDNNYQPIDPRGSWGNRVMLQRLVAVPEGE